MRKVTAINIQNQTICKKMKCIALKTQDLGYLRYLAMWSAELQLHLNVGK